MASSPEAYRKAMTPDIYDAIEDAVKEVFNWITTDTPYSDMDLDRMAKQVVKRTGEIEDTYDDGATS